MEDLVDMGVSNTVWAQVTLPMRHDGLGIRDPIQTQRAARIAALAGFELFGRDRVGVPRFHNDRPFATCATEKFHTS